MNQNLRLLFGLLFFVVLFWGIVYFFLFKEAVEVIEMKPTVQEITPKTELLPEWPCEEPNCKG